MYYHDVYFRSVDHKHSMSKVYLHRRNEAFFNFKRCSIYFDAIKLILCVMFIELNRASNF